MQSMGVVYALDRGYHLQNAMLLGGGERAFEQFAQARHDELDAHLDDEGRDHDGRYGFEDDPWAADKPGGADTDEGGYRRIGVAAVVQRVGDDGPVFQFVPYPERIAVEPLLGYDGDGRRDDGDQARSGRAGAREYRVDAACTVDEDDDRHAGEDDADDHRGQRFVAVVAVATLLFPLLRRSVHGEKYDDIGGEIRHGVYGVGEHRAAATEDAGDELAGRQDDVHEDSRQCHTVYSVLSSLAGARSGFVGSVRFGRLSFHKFSFLRHVHEVIYVLGQISNTDTSGRKNP